MPEDSPQELMIDAHEPLEANDPEVRMISNTVGIIDMLETIEEFGENYA